MSDTDKTAAHLEPRVATLLHDLRNPLAGVRGAVQIVRDRSPESPERDILGEVLVRLDEMKDMIDAASRSQS